jgi:predicted RNA-binding Zn-ribbon protein involved in translation (DUF1610 family)
MEQHKSWHNCHQIMKGFAEMTCPHCEEEVIVPIHQVYKYLYCPLCGEHVLGKKDKNHEQEKV